MNTSVGFQHRPGHLMIDHMTWSDVETLLNLLTFSNIFLRTYGIEKDFIVIFNSLISEEIF